MSAEVGSAHVSIFPTMNGFRTAVNKEMTAAAKNGSTVFSKLFKGVGAKTGKQVGKDTSDAFKQSTAKMGDDLVKNLKQQVSKAAQANSSALLKQKDATLAVQAAQEKLNATVAKYGEGSLQAQKAQIRLESAQLKASAASEAAAKATETLRNRQSALSAAQDALNGSSKSVGTAIGAMAASFRTGYDQAGKAEAQFKTLSSTLGGVAKSFGKADFITPIVTRMQKGSQSIETTMGKAFSKVTTGVNGVATTVASKLPASFRNAARIVGNYLTNIGVNATGLQKTVGRVFSSMGGIAGSAMRGVGNAFNGLKSVASTALNGLSVAGVAVFRTLSTAGLAATAAIGAAFVGVGKSALGAYATWEQAVGGVDTLFKDASGTVQAYAANAYKTAGVSANSYMQQITSFSASLISSLGGDTAAAAEMGNMAIVDMSDNANKMGTSLETIQQTYQSLARGNYAMLDNLKLGYGGTKAEMERMIADANKVKQANGEMADLSIDKFSDVVEAIHIVQTQLGITGTTAKEAATTIEGSVNSMKAAWGNWLAGLGQENADMSGLTNQLVSSIGTVMQNVLPRVKVIAQSLVQQIPVLFSGLVSLLPQPFQQAIGMAGQALSQGVETIKGMLSGIVQQVAPIVQGVADTIGGMFSGFMNGFTVSGGSLSALAGIAQLIMGLASPLGIVRILFEQFGSQIQQIASTVGPQIITVLQSLAQALGGAIGGVLPGIQAAISALLPVIGQVITTVGQILATVMPVIASLASQLVPVITTIAQVVGQLMATLAPIIASLVSTLLPVIQNIVNALMNLATAVMPIVIQVINTVMGIIQALMPVIQTIATVVSSVIGVIVTVIGQIISLVTNVVAVIVSAVSQVTGVISGIIQIVSGIFGTILSVIGGIVSGIVSTVSGAFNTVVNIISGAISSAVAFVTGFASSIANTFNGIAGAIGNAINGAANTLRSGFSGMVSAATGFIGNLVSTVGSIPGRIQGIFSNAGSMLVSAGRNIIQGLINGITGAISGAISAVQNAVGGIIDGAKSLLGIHSPSRVFRDEIGRMIPEGMALGVDDKAGKAVASVEDLAERIGAVNAIIPHITATGRPSANRGDGTDTSRHGRGLQVVQNISVPDPEAAGRAGVRMLNMAIA